jgi:CubicO group peptidase (beta-lactamase class C family)
MATHQFSGAVLVVRRGTVLLDQGYGWAAVLRRMPNTPASKYRFGSVTKQFTALAILLVQAQGKFHI